MRHLRRPRRLQMGGSRRYHGRRRRRYPPFSAASTPLCPQERGCLSTVTICCMPAAYLAVGDERHWRAREALLDWLGTVLTEGQRRRTTVVFDARWSASRPPPRVGETRHADPVRAARSRSGRRAGRTCRQPYGAAFARCRIRRPPPASGSSATPRYGDRQRSMGGTSPQTRAMRNASRTSRHRPTRATLERGTTSLAG